MDSREIVDRFIAALDGETRTLAAREWGISLTAAGWPLHIGVALRDGLLRAQAQVVGPGAIAPETLLRWHRDVPLVRFAQTRAGEVWLHGELPLAAIADRELDRFLGLFVRVATEAREAAQAADRSR